MKPMWIAFAAMIVISIGAWYGLEQIGFSAQDRTSSNTVRLN
jgi:hypothetical protein